MVWFRSETFWWIVQGGSAADIDQSYWEPIHHHTDGTGFNTSLENTIIVCLDWDLYICVCACLWNDFLLVQCLCVWICLWIVDGLECLHSSVSVSNVHGSVCVCLSVCVCICLFETVCVSVWKWTRWPSWWSTRWSTWWSMKWPTCIIWLMYVLYPHTLIYDTSINQPISPVLLLDDGQDGGSKGGG